CSQRPTGSRVNNSEWRLRTMSRVPLVRPALLTGFGACAALLLSVLPGASGETTAKQDAKPTAEEKALATSLKKATAAGKYQMLLRQIKVADDKDNYGDFSDYGLYGGTDYAGYSDLPK